MRQAITLPRIQILFGLIVGVGLTYISIQLNVSFANVLANSEEAKKILPKSYALVNIAGVFFVMALSIGIKNWFVRCTSFAMVIVITALSLFTSLSFQLVNDSTHALESTGKQLARQEQIFNASSSLVDKSEKSLDGTQIHKSKFRGHLQEDITSMKAESTTLTQMEKSKVEPYMVVFKAIENMTGIAATSVMLFVRLLWSVAAEISTLLTLAIAGFWIRDFAAARTKETEVEDDLKVDLTALEADSPPSESHATKGGGQNKNIDRAVTKSHNIGLSGPSKKQSNVVAIRAKEKQKKAQEEALESIKKEIITGEMQKISKSAIKKKGHGDNTAMYVLSELRDQNVIEKFGNHHKINPHIIAGWSELKRVAR